MARRRRNFPKERERFLVGVARYVIEMSGNDELKVRRSVVSTIRDRVTAKFPVSFADVGPQDVHDEAILGVAAVSGDRDFLRSILEKIPEFIDGLGVCRVISEDYDISAY